jgi:hypothetical protein
VPGTTTDNAAGAAVVVLTRLPTSSLAWGWAQLARGAVQQPRFEGLRLARIMGSGRQGGFGLVPSLHVQGLVALFDTVEHAERYVHEAPAVQARLDRADPHESLVAVLATLSSKGAWGGVSLQPTEPRSTHAGGPLAVITRASIKANKAAAFWRHAAPSEASLARSPGCQLAVGLGEAPLLRQFTLSVWDSAAQMQSFAQQGSHGQASRSAWQHGWFSEWLFARLHPVRLRGRWAGTRFDVQSPGMAT